MVLRVTAHWRLPFLADCLASLLDTLRNIYIRYKKCSEPAKSKHYQKNSTNLAF